MIRSFPVLHALALRRRADLESLERSTGLARADLESTLGHAVIDGLVLAARSNFLLTPKGAAWLEDVYPTEHAGPRADVELGAEVDRFDVINRELKALVTEWQTITVGGKSMLNDHSDAAYDDRILGRLSELHVRAVAMIGRLARRVPRLARYADRLGDALGRAEGGESEWVSGVRCDSYHTVWFEMHEDLLRLLGRQREE